MNLIKEHRQGALKYSSVHFTTSVAGTGAEVDKRAGSLLQSHPVFLSEFLGSQDAQSLLHCTKADVAVSCRWWTFSLPLPYVVMLKFLPAPALFSQLFHFFLVAVPRSFELQKFLLSLYPSHQLFGIVWDLFGGFVSSTFEHKTIFGQDVSKRKQSE